MNTTSDNPQASTTKPVRILVVEDSPLNQQVALKQLEKLGYTADAVADGELALEAHARTPYDIILMDCQMPGISGYEATWQIRIREQEKTGAANAVKRVYIIAMTANTQADNREKCSSAGMDGFINKPVQLPELEAALMHALADQMVAKKMDEVIDPVVIAGLRQLRTPGKPDPLAELIDLFVREAPTQLDIMSDAVAKNDMTSLTRTISAASALKGSAGNLGARNLAALCDEIEQTAKNWILADTQPLIERAREEFSRAQSTLERIKKS
ncbi:MAG TPA: response regulator [Verrucomicrobiae bacterium]|nr:response regulator [Verrucomicrobiae bacterium]